MPFIPVLSTAMVELFMRLDGQRIENTLYFRKADAYEAEDLATLASDVVNWYTDSVLPNLSSDLSLVAVKATSLESATAPAIEFTSGLPQSGGSGDASVSNNVTLVVKFLTAGRGRSSRGRNYVPGLPITQVAQNTVNSTRAGLILDGYTALLDVGVITEGIHSVVSRFEDGDPREFGIAQHVTGYGLTDFTVDSQRRRLPGRGS